MNIEVKLIRYDREEKGQWNLLKELTWFFAFRRREISRELKQYSSISHHDILFIGVSQFLDHEGAKRSSANETQESIATKVFHLSPQNC